MPPLVETERLVIELLLVLSLVAIGVRWLRIPYTVALVLVGLLISLQGSQRLELTPELIMALFVPPLVFEAAFQLRWQDLSANFRPIILLAVPGVLVTTLLVGTVVALGAGLPWGTSLVFGALISATDPIAVTALFRTLGSPRRLAVIVEGESLFNDGTAIVVFGLAVSAAMAIQEGLSSQPVASQVVAAAITFLRVSFVGLLVGSSLGWLVSLVIARLDDYLIETTLTMVLAFGAYLLAEQLHASGVLAVVAAGIITGSLGVRGMSPTTRIVLTNFWEYLAFIVNSFVFLLIGLAINLSDIAANWLPVAIAVIAVLASRALVIYGLAGAAGSKGDRLPRSYRHVLFWGGMRGAISLALALSLPAALAGRDLVRAMAFAVVLFTLTAQGTTIGSLLKRLKLVRADPMQLEYERRHARLAGAQSARAHLRQLYESGALPRASWESLDAALETEVNDRQADLQDLLCAHPELQSRQIEQAWREGLLARRASLSAMRRDGAISDPVYEELAAEIDSALQALRLQRHDLRPVCPAPEEPPATNQPGIEAPR